MDGVLRGASELLEGSGAVETEPPDQLGDMHPVTQFPLGQDARDVALHRRLAEPEAAGDLPVAAATADMEKHLPLALAEQSKFDRLVRLVGNEAEVSEEPAGDAGRQERAVGRDGPDRGAEILARGAEGG